MKFHDPWLLLLLVLVPVWLWRQGYLTGRGGLQYSSVATAKTVTSFWSTTGPTVLLLMRGLALTAVIVAMARPQIGRSESRMHSEGIDIVLVLDISGSMQAADYKKDGKAISRVNVVKDVVREFIKARPNDRIGMVVFGTHAYVASPLTLDHDWLERNLDRIRIGLVEGNTAIGAGIGTGVNRLRDTKAKSKVVILLTDGGENVRTPPAIEAAKAAKAMGVRVYTIGVGSDTKQPVPVYNDSGQFLGSIVADLDEDLLGQIAKETGGQYFRAADTDALKSTYDQIDKMEKQQIETVKYEDWTELFPWFLAPGLGCLLAAVTLEQTRLRRLP
jgi:Ca-activated chloride channel family protein